MNPMMFGDFVKYFDLTSCQFALVMFETEKYIVNKAKVYCLFFPWLPREFALVMCLKPKNILEIKQKCIVYFCLGDLFEKYIGNKAKVDFLFDCLRLIELILF